MVNLVLASPLSAMHSNLVPGTNSFSIVTGFFSSGDILANLACFCCCSVIAVGLLDGPAFSSIGESVGVLESILWDDIELGPEFGDFKGFDARGTSCSVWIFLAFGSKLMISKSETSEVKSMSICFTTAGRPMACRVSASFLNWRKLSNAFSATACFASLFDLPEAMNFWSLTYVINLIKCQLLKYQYIWKQNLIIRNYPELLKVNFSKHKKARIK